MLPMRPSMDIARLRLRNIRGFRHLDLDLLGSTGTPRRRTVVIGKNGTCKTTILRAIALGLCDRTDAHALISEPIGSMVSSGSKKGLIEVDLVPRRDEGDPVTLRKVIENDGNKEAVFDDSSSPFSLEHLFVCGYGAGRSGFGSDTGRTYRIADSVFTLFNYRQTLIDPELTLRRLQDFLGSETYTSTLAGIQRALGLTPDDRIQLLRGGGIEVSGPSVGAPVRLEAWADGYRVTFSWLLDLYAWALRADRVGPEGTVEGIILVDELEQHLHPSMQADVLPRLSELLPMMQLFVTTHSPLVALDTSPDELVVLRREHGEVVQEETVPDFSGYSAEDMLVDERLFDSQIYGPEMREKISRYEELAAIPRASRAASDTDELRSLAMEIREQELPPAKQSEATRELHRILTKHGL